MPVTTDFQVVDLGDDASSTFYSDFRPQSALVAETPDEAVAATDFMPLGVSFDEYADDESLESLVKRGNRVPVSAVRQ